MALQQQILAVASLLLAYVVSIVVYRLYFHPLANVPGPFWARISGFPAYWHTLKRDRHVWFWCLQEQYGPTFRFGPDDVLVNTPSGLKTIFNAKANVKKAQYYKAYPRNIHSATTWNSVDRDVHARKRRVLNNAFSDKALRSAEPFIHANVDRWCDLLGDEIKTAGQGKDAWSGSLNMAHWADHLIFDILGDLCFGESFGMKEADSKLRFVPKLMTDFLGIIHPIAFSPFASFWVWAKPRGLNQMLASSAPPALKNWEDFVEGCFSRRAKIEEDLKTNPKPDSEVRKDFFHYLFRAIDPETGKLGYTLDELYGESEMLIIAGSDTTAITTAAAFFYLSRNPAIQETIAREVAAAFPTVDDVKGGPALHGCHTLQAFIKETLRMSPPVPADLSREVLEGGLVVDGTYFAPGVRVSTACYCMHHSKDLYDEPFQFKPSRWIVDERDPASAEKVARAESGYMPFSAGPRSCPGKNLAYLEMGIVLAKVLRSFEIRRDPSSNLGGGSPDAREGRREVDQFQLHEIFVAIRDGPLVQLKKRVHA